ncbi:hypothetical protein VC83_03855 [Pseudogymnoascus destructans]|uniref:Uncharacterized protein n=1 Tax=Pseudogymnoascus destructans TaxID=655981 RepID=A0A177AEM2_9PEZI|nr:uncharacterized protein VC83_03855 [Pseudogymnoascus destructans]OAF59862.1 hypothetical protein VC83_03855 [Pseudogymnoascus destructans]
MEHKGRSNWYLASRDEKYGKGIWKVVVLQSSTFLFIEVCLRILGGCTRGGGTNGNGTAQGDEMGDIVVVADLWSEICYGVRGERETKFFCEMIPWSGLYS